MFIAIFVAAIIAVVMFHEFGHFATAKLFRMKAEQFFFGFGPTVWSTKRGDTEYGWKAIPAGGFVKIAGMNRYEAVDPNDHGRLFYEKPAWQRLIVLASGSATHFVVAFALLFVGLAFVGAPTAVASNVVSLVMPDSPAAAAGLLEGDRVVAVNGTATPDFESARALISERGGEELTLTVERDDQTLELTATPAAQNPDGERVGYLGISPEPVVQRYSLGGALAETISGDYSVVRLTGATIVGLGQAFNPSNLAAFFGSVGSEEPRSLDDPSPSSLVGAGQLVNAFGQEGDIFSVLVLLASLNIVLGTVNMIPLPPLDGGHAAVLVIEEVVNGVRRLRRVPGERWQMDPSVLTPIALAVIAFFVVLSLTAVYQDITRPITEGLQQ